MLGHEVAVVSVDSESFADPLPCEMPDGGVRVSGRRCREECQAELSTMRQQIWDLMHAEAPATYQPSDLKRVGKEDL